MSTPQLRWALFAPQHWPSWIGAGLWFLLTLLPYRWLMAIGRALAPVLKRNKKRMQMARVNLEKCFPDMPLEAREALLAKNIESMGMALMETGIAWFWPTWRLKRLFGISGLEHIEKVAADGQGALLLSLHFSTLDIGSAMLGVHVNYDGMYSPHKNPVFDYCQKKRREAYCKGGIAIARDNVRQMVSRLRQGRFVWYAPDRDLGPKVSIFVPFFATTAATVTATSQFARLGRARILPFSQYRRPDGSGYDVVVHPPFENFPTGDDYADARRVNAFMETEILKYPEQYFWAQPRLKTRPEGEAKFY